MSTADGAGILLMLVGVVLLVRAAIVIVGRTPGAFRFDGLSTLFAAIALIALGRLLIS